MRVLVTGASGTGKTTIGRRMKEDLGLAVIEADCDTHNGLSIAYWADISTGLGVWMPAARGEDWCLTHNWTWRVDTLGGALDAEGSPIVVVCGAASNFEDALFLFDRVFILVADEYTIGERTRTRADHDFGTLESEYRQVLAHNKRMSCLAKSGAGTLVDTTGADVDDVLSTIALALRKDQILAPFHRRAHQNR